MELFLHLLVLAAILLPSAWFSCLPSLVWQLFFCLEQFSHGCGLCSFIVQIPDYECILNRMHPSRHLHRRCFPFQPLYGYDCQHYENHISLTLMHTFNILIPSPSPALQHPLLIIPTSVPSHHQSYLYVTSCPFHYFSTPMSMEILCLMGHLVYWVALTGYLSCCQVHKIMAIFPYCLLSFQLLQTFLVASESVLAMEKVARVRMLIRVTSHKKYANDA